MTGAAWTVGILLVGLAIFIAWRWNYAVPAITEAVIAGDIERVKQMLDAGTDPNTTAPFLMLLSRDRFGGPRNRYTSLSEMIAGVFYRGQQQAIILTASSGQWAPTNWQIVELLLRHDVDMTTEDAWFTFMFALASQRFDITDKMLARGFQLDRKEGRNIDAPLKLTTRGNIEACRYLLSKGASLEPLFYIGPVQLPDGTSKNVANTLFVPPQKNQAEIYRLLIDHGLPLHLDLFGESRTILNVAVELEDVEFAKYLLDRGFNVQFHPDDHPSALDVAREKQNAVMIELLEAATERQANTGAPSLTNQ